MKYKDQLVALSAGVAAAIFLIFLGAGWIGLGFRAPVAAWLSEHDFSWLIGKWSLLWVHLPNYFVALLLGYIVGRYLRLRWWKAAIFGSTGYFILPQIYYVLDQSYRAFGIDVIAHTMLWGVVTVPMICISSWLGEVRKSRITNRSM